MMCLTKLMLAVVIVLAAARPLTMHQRVIAFCELYERAIDCPAWVQGAMTTAYDLALDCHQNYPAPKDVQMFYCLEEYGF